MVYIFLLGKIPILTNIFKMGWNHQLVNQCIINHLYNMKHTIINHLLGGLLMVDGSADLTIKIQ